MNYLRSEANPVKRFCGLSIVVLLHVLLAYGLVTGSARKMINVLHRPVETKIIEELKPPPPPMDTMPPPPRMKAPPPPYMPLPEIRIQEPQSANTITQVTNVPPPAQPFVKTVVEPPVPVAARAAPVVAQPPPVPAFMDLNACKPEYPRASLLSGEQGTVRVQFVIGTAGQLVSAKVVKSSGYKNLDKAAVDGLSRCTFKAAYQDDKPVQSSFMSEYVWTLGD